jgi:hypothetical protein
MNTDVEMKGQLKSTNLYCHILGRHSLTFWENVLPAVSCLAYSLTLKMEAVHAPETLVNTY